MQTQNNNSITKKLYIDTMSNSNFINLINSYNLADKLYNELLAVHCLLLGIQCTGIKEASIHLNYMQTTQEGYDFDIPAPDLRYSFLTTQYGVIEERQCGKDSVKVKNSNFPKFYSPRTFKSFLDQYWFKNIKHMNGNSLNDFSEYCLEIKIKKNYNKYTKYDILYNEIIENAPNVKSFLQWHFLDNLINIKENMKVTNKKIKL